MESFLRNLKIDELPQVINFIKGDINLVGPRPGLENQKELLIFRRSHGVHNFKPGITGLAQVLGYDMSNPELLSKIDNLITEDLNTPLELEFQDNSVLIELCGIRGQNLIFLEDKLAIQITRRGNKLSFSGNLEDRQKAADILKSIYSSLEEGRFLDGNDIIDFVLRSLK